MYDVLAEVFVALVFALYVAFLTALAWWALGDRLHFAPKRWLFFASDSATEDVLGFVVAGKGRRVEGANAEPITSALPDMVDYRARAASRRILTT